MERGEEKGGTSREYTNSEFANNIIKWWRSHRNATIPLIPKIPLQATSLHPLALFTVHVTGTLFPSSDDLLLPEKGSHPHLYAQEKHTYCNQKALGRSSPPGSSFSKRSGLEGSLRRMSRDRGETELFQLGHHIVVAVETDDLPLPELED